MDDTVLEVKNLEVRFLSRKSSVTAVQGVEFKMRKGKTLGVVGESGCGKSVTAHSIMRLLPKRTSEISDGEILLDGKNILECSEKEMQSIRGNKISMIFQDPMTSLNPVYTIGDQMMEMILAHNKMPKKQAYDIAVQMLEQAGIHEPVRRMNEYPHQLSGGMRQRVMIAMALSCKPEVLIADEPTTALDVTIQAQILDLMDDLKKNYDTAILMITHDMGVIAEVADEVMVMYAGQVVEYGDVKQIFKETRHPYTQGLLKSIPRLDQEDELFTIEGTVPSLYDMPYGCRFADRCPYCMEKCREQAVPLFSVSGTKVRCFLYEAE